ncbi:MAG TPA: hypothetical protein VFC29_14585 [Candidatus Limnocylindrales bacterium]|jgi:hypothetical protein|nr:hypothetical protein [Candidatus Limnocylindrales bacterium]
MHLRSASIVLFLAVAGSVIVACGQEPATFNFNDITTQPFRLNTLETTPFGPAWADILVRPENFLLCQGAPIALCFYSGPGPVTPCFNDGAHPGRSNCTCYEIPAGSPYLVDINAILNRDVYLETVKTCGQGGENCLPRGKMPAPVCDAINQNTLIPGAELISTFSFALESSMPTNQQTSCTNAAPYAGCMTAPCKKTGAIDPTTGLPLVQCACPNYAGPFEVPQDLSQTGNRCSFGNISTWSAAYAPLGGGIAPPSPPPCYPDVAGVNGCPLLSPDPPVIPPPPPDISCKKVCSEYAAVNKAGVEVGFTCDSTLCTVTNDFDLVLQACAGLQKDPVGEVLRLETEVGFSCAASQICGCAPKKETNDEIYNLNESQRERGISPQCDLNGTLCGTAPESRPASGVDK